jgi:Flp pilus assembly secretin CpaC
MRRARVFAWVSLLLLAAAASAQQTAIDPQVRTKATTDHKITTIELRSHFVTTIRVPEAVNAVVVGDPVLFQVEHSEHEPELVFVKALTAEDAESNLLISTAKGRQISFLLVSHGRSANPAKVDFLLRYQTADGFLIEPEAVPYALVAQTASVSKPESPAAGPIASTAQAGGTSVTAEYTPIATPETSSQSKPDSLDGLLERQKRAPLPVLFGERMEGDDVKGDRLRTGISEVLDGGQQVIVLFSVVNTSKHAILLMPPQIQLGGKEKTGKLIKHEHWSTAEQLPVIDFRLSRRRIGRGERADGVVVFERPPYKRSNETLFLQMAESGAVDKPALAPIGFGVSTLREAANHAQ